MDAAYKASWNTNKEKNINEKRGNYLTLTDMETMVVDIYAILCGG